ncbi:uncharacterized protein METZ01_LOCUS386234, partial [marine metagenome]
YAYRILYGGSSKLKDFYHLFICNLGYKV